MLVSYNLPFEALCDCGLAFIGHRWMWMLRATSPQTRMNTVFPLACITFPKGHLFNELYARDISRKIRSAFDTRMAEGHFIGAHAPYGYRRDPLDRRRLIPDPEAAGVVRELFARAAEGETPRQIARIFNERGILPPLAYRCGKTQTDCPQKHGEWTPPTIAKMLQNEVYLGHMAQGKSRKASLKSRTSVPKARRDWFVVPNTHEALVTREAFEQAARLRRGRACPPAGRFVNLFSGLTRCADCGRAMSTVGTRKKGASANLACGGYKQRGRGECANHFINYDDLCALVLHAIREAARLDDRTREGVLRAAERRLKGQGEQGGLPRERLERLLCELTQPDALDGALLAGMIARVEIGQGAYTPAERGRVKKQRVRIVFRFR